MNEAGGVLNVFGKICVNGFFHETVKNRDFDKLFQFGKGKILHILQIKRSETINE